MSDSSKSAGGSMTVAEVARFFHVSVEVALSWIRAGELKALNVGRSRSAKRPTWRITRAALDAFEASRTATPEPAVKRQRRAKPVDVIEFYQ